MSDKIRLTQHCSAAGCGCKLSSANLSEILSGLHADHSENLITGNTNSEDSVAYKIGPKNESGEVLLSTIDFFTPIVDDPFDFGYVAAANALSDIYAMGGRPVFAMSVLAWPVKNLETSVAREVVQGAIECCRKEGVVIAGGHSIENPEPLFGLSVNGFVKEENLKKNSGAREGDLLYLTKPLGTGICSTAMKRDLLGVEDQKILTEHLKMVNRVGYKLGGVKGVRAMTDVTGFSLAGHLSEVCRGSSVGAVVELANLPLLTDLSHYINQKAIPGGTKKNIESFQDFVVADFFADPACQGFVPVVFDPQTNGGLLVVVSPDYREEVETILGESGHYCNAIGKIVSYPKPQSGNGGYITFT